MKQVNKVSVIPVPDEKNTEVHQLKATNKSESITKSRGRNSVAYGQITEYDLSKVNYNKETPGDPQLVQPYVIRKYEISLKFVCYIAI